MHCRYLIIAALVLALSSCESITDPDEGRGSGGSGGGRGSSTDRYITLLDADITVMNTQTSQPVGGALGTVSTATESGSAYSNSEGLADIYEEISIKISEGTSGMYVDISVSAPNFGTVTIDEYLVNLTFLESGSGWAHYGLVFSHTVNITPDSGALPY